ncbi:MAG TPA: hypothetical protein VHZ09_16155 [Acidobacteriaceae bacterium]|jgi:hypothetical protein|nr:hypothetical protein [Acidobacteriaceae bacterium]
MPIRENDWKRLERVAKEGSIRYLRRDDNTRVTGMDSGEMGRVESDSGVSDACGLAPAIEYSWKPYIGVLLGVRMIPAGRNTDQTITPAIAINFVH